MLLPNNLYFPQIYNCRYSPEQRGVLWAVAAVPTHGQTGGKLALVVLARTGH